MFPIILRLGSLNIYSYGLMLFISFVVGIKIVEKRAKKFGVDPKKITDLALVVLIGVIIGARLLYVIFHFSEFKDDLVSIIAFWRGGLAVLMFYGGLVFAILAGIFYVQRQKLPLLKMLDAVAPAIVLGEFFTRLGCFLNGCCFGKPTNSFLGIVFPANSPAGYVFPHTPIHPTQLYSSLAGLLLFNFSLWLEKKRLGDGVLFFIILALYSLYRFLIDFVRYYEDSGNFWINQAISVGFCVVALIMLFYLRKRNVAER
uniref:Phosphatidylglycerol--prolipoprotein diacylglyceryl transferase n=1 Tax=candidate division WOR-3 bacterium TaxID=2052148 RepID=A0A7C6EAM0_UNCW3